MQNIRLFINSEKLSANQLVKISDGDFGYLVKVMRRKIGDEVSIFNGKDGQWLARINEINKKDCQIEVLKQEKQQVNVPNITIAFAPVKNIRIDFIAAKATELGVANFQPILTHHSVVDKINIGRFEANVKEAAEQCERLDIPQVRQIIKLDKFIKNLHPNQILILCDESGQAGKASEVLSKISCTKENEVIIFIGPEGGFSVTEFENFRKLDNIHPISLGPRILRADTAIISSITLVQEFLGDY